MFELFFSFTVPRPRFYHIFLFPVVFLSRLDSTWQINLFTLIVMFSDSLEILLLKAATTTQIHVFFQGYSQEIYVFAYKWCVVYFLNGENVFVNLRLTESALFHPMGVANESGSEGYHVILTNFYTENAHIFHRRTGTTFSENLTATSHLHTGIWDLLLFGYSLINQNNWGL